MRQIGHLDSESAARTFGDFLFVQGIENQIESEKGLGWAIWIRAEDEIERASQLLADFRAHPTDPMFHSHAQSATKLREQNEKADAAYRKKIKDRAALFRSLAGYGLGPVTFVLIAACVVVFILSRFGNDVEKVAALFISDYDVRGGFLNRFAGLPEIRAGEVWRLFTPVLLHFNFLHVVFNVLWLHDLGGMIEGRQKSWLLALLVAVLAVVSNLAQYGAGGPIFGGMSGVVYGLLGYVWLRGKFDPASGLFLHPHTVVMMIIWFFVCLIGLIPHVANTAHGAGLVIGMAWGYLSSLRRR